MVDLPLWKIWKSVGIIIPNIWKETCSKPLTSNYHHHHHYHIWGNNHPLSSSITIYVGDDHKTQHSMDWYKRNFTVLVPPPSWWHGASCHGTFPGTWTLLIRQRSDVWLAATLTTDWWSRDTFWCGGLSCWVVLLMLVLGASFVYLAVLPEWT